MSDNVHPHPGARTQGIKGTSQFLDAIADRFRCAYDGMPISSIMPEIPYPNIGIAYAIQETNTRIWIDEGKKLVGRKIGRVSSAVQKQLNLTDPDFGMLFDDMKKQNGETINLGDYHQPKVSAEIAFQVSEDIQVILDNESQLIRHLDALMPAIEVADSRVENWQVTSMDTVADNACAGVFVLGPPVSMADVSMFPSMGCTIFENGKKMSGATCTDCTGYPLKASLALVQKMVRTGRPLRKGDIILSGSPAAMIDMQSGCDYEVQIANMGSVSVKSS